MGAFFGEVKCLIIRIYISSSNYCCSWYSYLSVLGGAFSVVRLRTLGFDAYCRCTVRNGVQQTIQRTIVRQL